MRRLLPTYDEDLTDADLLAAYAYPPTPDGGRWLRANMVSTADGAATADGVSHGISGDADRRLFLLQRGLADAVVVGARTVRVEGYGPGRPREEFAELRKAAGQAPAPAVAVITNSLDLDFGSALFTDAVTPTIVITGEAAPADRLDAARAAGEVLVAGAGMVDLTCAIEALSARGHRRLLCEGGPHLLAQLAGAGLLDELCLTVSPLLVGGTAPRVLTGAGPAEPARLRIGHVLEEDAFLFLRYGVAR
jgi:riboflavin biosynthesis pyrimidine reductase